MASFKIMASSSFIGFTEIFLTEEECKNHLK